MDPPAPHLTPQSIVPDSQPSSSQPTGRITDELLTVVAGDPDVEMSDVSSQALPGPSKLPTAESRKGGKGGKSKASVSYSVIVDGQKMDAKLVNKILEDDEGGNRKTEADIDFSNKVSAATSGALIGYVWMDVIDPDQVMQTGYINGRQVDIAQAELLRAEFIEHGCFTSVEPLAAAVDDINCFVDLEGKPIQCSKSPSDAPKVHIKPGHHVLRIAGGHRTEAVVREWIDAKEKVQQREKIKGGLNAEAVKATTKGADDLNRTNKSLLSAEAWFHNVDTNWRWWLVKIYTQEELDKDGEVMGAVRVDLGNNRQKHLYEGTPREKFHMAYLSPASARSRLSQHQIRLWESRGFRLIINLWVHFLSLPELPCLEVGTNERRIHEPWFGIWALLVAESFEMLREAVIAPEGQRTSPYISSIYYSVINTDVHNTIDAAFTKHLLPKLRENTICDDDGHATKDWLTAFTLYSSTIIMGLGGLTQRLCTPPSAQPKDWPTHRAAAVQQLIDYVETCSRSVTEFQKTNKPVNIRQVLPLFCNTAAQTYVTLAQQVGPAVSVLAELLEPAWRNFKPGSGKTEAAGRSNRRAYDLPDDGLLLKFHADKRMRSKVDSDDGKRTWAGFFHRLVFSGWGTALSARVVSLNLRAFDGSESPPKTVPGCKVMDHVPPPPPAPKVKVKGGETPPTHGSVKKGVLGYLRARILSVANDPPRPNLAPGTLRDWTTWQKAGDKYKSYVAAEVEEFFSALVDGNSYFKTIAPLIPVSIDEHVNSLFSTLQFLRSIHSAELQCLVPTPEFHVVWTAWVDFSKLGGMVETVWYHAFVDVDATLNSEMPKVDTAPFLLCFEGEGYPKPASPTSPQRKASAVLTRATRRRRGKGSAKQGNDDGDTGSDEDDEQSHEGKAKPKGKGKSGGRSKRKRESAGDVSTQPAAKKGAQEDVKSEPGILSRTKIVDSDSEAAISTLRSSNELFERQCGWSLGQLDLLVTKEHLNVMGVHDGFCSIVGQYATEGLSLGLRVLLNPIRWSSLLALATYGKSTYSFWLPATTRTMEPEWDQAVQAFNSEVKSFRPPPHDPLTFLKGKSKNEVGYLPITVRGLGRLRDVTQSTAPQWEKAEDVPGLEQVTGALVKALKANLVAGDTGGEGGEVMDVDEAEEAGEQTDGTEVHGEEDSGKSAEEDETRESGVSQQESEEDDEQSTEEDGEKSDTSMESSTNRDTNAEPNSSPPPSPSRNRRGKGDQAAPVSPGRASSRIKNQRSNVQIERPVGVTSVRKKKTGAGANVPGDIAAYEDV